MRLSPVRRVHGEAPPRSPAGVSATPILSPASGADVAEDGWSWSSRFLFLFVCVVWGFNFLFVRVGLSDATALWLALLRAAIGAGAAAVLLTAVRGWGRLDRAGRRDALLLGLPNTAAFYALLFVAIQSVLPGVAAVLTYTFPLWVALLSPAVLGHRLGVRQWLALGAGFLGVALVAQIASVSAGGLSLVPVLELLGSAVAWAVGTVVFQRRFDRAQMLEANAFQLVGGSVALLALVILLGPTPLPTFAPSLDISLVWLGILGTALAYSIWFDLLGRTRAATLSAYAFLVPVVALAGSVVFFGEHLGPLQVVGVALVLVSIYGLGRSAAQQSSRPPGRAGREERRSSASSGPATARTPPFGTEPPTSFRGARSYRGSGWPLPCPRLPRYHRSLPPPRN